MYVCAVLNYKNDKSKKLRLFKIWQCSQSSVNSRHVCMTDKSCLSFYANQLWRDQREFPLTVFLLFVNGMEDIPAVRSKPMISSEMLVSGESEPMISSEQFVYKDFTIDQSYYRYQTPDIPGIVWLKSGFPECNVLSSAENLQPREIFTIENDCISGNFSFFH